MQPLKPDGKIVMVDCKAEKNASQGFYMNKIDEDFYYYPMSYIANIILIFVFCRFMLPSCSDPVIVGVMAATIWTLSPLTFPFMLFAVTFMCFVPFLGLLRTFLLGV